MVVSKKKESYNEVERTGSPGWSVDRTDDSVGSRNLDNQEGVKTKELTITNDEPAWLVEEDNMGVTAGTEEAGAEDLALPTINILQALSPICDKTKPEYVEGMEPGMMYNTVTGEAYADGILFCPCYFRTEFSVFASRNAGGGFFGSFATQDEAQQAIRVIAQEQKKVPEAFETVRTATHYGLLFDDDHAPYTAVIRMTSSKLAASRQWITMIRMTGKSAYAYRYRITTVSKSNQQGSWFTYDIKQADYLSDDHIQAARDLYELAKAMPFNKAPETPEF